jgi:ribonuclease BN (tRNA processing enzyme)
MRAAITPGMAQVRLRFVGSGDAFAGGGRFQACLHLEGGTEPMLIDCGATSLVALKRERIDPNSIGWIVLSHLHGDHFAGIPWLILDGQFNSRTRPLVIAGPPSTQQRFNAAFEALYPGATTAERPFETRFIEMPERVATELGPALVTPFEVVHGGGAPPYALRIEYAGKVIAYSGDTDWTDELPEVADGADVFVCECSFFESEVQGHLNYRTLTAKRSKLGCRRLVLTHMSEEMLGHLDQVDVETASDGAVIEL